MIFIGYILVVFIGFVLGLIGGGGSILILPVLVYLMDIDPVSATAYSLIIIGLVSLFGARKYYQNGDIEFYIGVIFSIPAALGVFFSRKILLPSMPEVLVQSESFLLTKGLAIMIFFSIIMLLSGISMIFIRSSIYKKENNIQNWKVGLEGLIVGIVTGLVGAGGGFLIVPALVVLTGLTIKKAIGTSLMIIAFKSLFGVFGEWGNEIEWFLIGKISILAILGVYLGAYLSKFVEGNKLKRIFGVFVLLVALVIVFKEILIFVK